MKHANGGGVQGALGIAPCESKERGLKRDRVDTGTKLFASLLAKARSAD